ncbi:UNVERIFIED_CONTAM: small acid-soluble spore protein H (minor) [Acetivibrio alkalicellulosi]
MDTIRAKQILKSDGVIEVLYEGAPIWIENVIDNKADISVINTNEKKNVSVNMLIEAN